MTNSPVWGNCLNGQIKWLLHMTRVFQACLEVQPVLLLEGPYVGGTCPDLLEWETLVARDLVLHLNFDSLQGTCADLYVVLLR